MSALSHKKKATLRDEDSQRKKLSKKWQKLLKWFFIISIIILLLLTLVASYVWFNRYNLSERYVERFFSQQGIEAELSIKSFSKEAAVIEDIKLTYQSDVSPFFSASRIEADYILEEALNGRMKKLRLVKPEARITLDEKFQIIDGWMPPKSNNNGTGVSIPEKGLFIEDASFQLTSPYGDPSFDMTAEIWATDKFDATLILSPTRLEYKTFNLDGSARVDLKVTGDKKDIDSLIKLESLNGETSTGETVSIEQANLIIKGELTASTGLPVNLDTLDALYNGIISGDANRIVTPPGTLKNSQFDWLGKVSRDTNLAVRLGSQGRLNIKTEDFTFSDSNRAKDLAKTLTLSDALSKTPIAQHFGPSVTRNVESLLSSSSFETSVDINFDNKVGTVSLITPLTAQKSKTKLIVTAIKDLPFYQWNRTENTLDLSLNAALNKPVPLKLNNMTIQAKTQNGWRLEGVKAFKSGVNTASVWNTKSKNESARLGPFKAQLNYTATEKQRDLMVIGGVDFDGRVPGGYVEGLETRGRVDIRLAPHGQQGLNLSYKPTRPEIKLDSLLTYTDWRIDNLTFNLDEGKDVFRLFGNTSAIKANLSQTRFLLSHKTDGRNLNLSVQSVDVEGGLNLNSQVQNWALNFESANILSDTVPVEGTTVYVPQGQLNVEKRPEDLLFDFATPSLDVKVPQGQVKSLKVSAKGTPTNYDVTHSGGVFALETVDVPDWPVTGAVKFENNRFVGQARANIPTANNTPVDIQYDFADGAGQADIKIESLTFAPGKLQPQSLLPSFAGKLARVDGTVAADLSLAFTDGAIQSSGGTLNVIDMSFGTAPGPISGLNTEIKLTSLFPLRTAGRQNLTMALFDPGIPLENGTIEYELLPNGILLHAAKWPIGSGNFELDPFTWRYGAEENRVVMKLREIPLNEVLENYGDGKLQATGILKGEFPIVVRGINVLVDKGYVEVPEGGIIRYNSNEGTAVTYSQEEALDIIRRQDTPQYRSLARDALREFSYRELRATVDGPLDGDVSLGVIFDGRNKKVLNGQPFEFDIDVQGELFNIMRSFNSNAQIKSQLLRNNLTAVE